MNRPATLVLVRHGESERNVAKRGNPFFADDTVKAKYQGTGDHRVALTNEGARQAQLTGKGLVQRFGRFDQLYHSGYVRTEDTAQHILAAMPDDIRAAMGVAPNLFIRERDTGHTYDMTTAEGQAVFPYMQSYWQVAGSFFARPPGGESIADVAQRVQLFIDALCRDHGGQQVVVVTHAGTIRAFRFLLEQWTYEQAEWHLKPHNISPNCGVTTYRVSTDNRALQLEDADVVYW